MTLVECIQSKRLAILGIGKDMKKLELSYMLPM
jgi:hypothetical protein